MAHRTPLAQYILDRLGELDETPEQFAERIGINSSGLYKLLRGQYSEPRQATLDKIARGLGTTPAGLFTAIGQGNGDTTPDESELLAIYRLIGLNYRPTIKTMLRGLAGRPGFQPDSSGSPDESVDYIYQASGSLAVAGAFA